MPTGSRQPLIDTPTRVILDYVNRLVKTNHYIRIVRIVKWIGNIAMNMLSKLFTYRGQQNSELIVCCG